MLTPTINHCHGVAARHLGRSAAPLKLDRRPVLPVADFLGRGPGLRRSSALGRWSRERGVEAALICALLTALVLPGCQLRRSSKPDYDRPLPPGTFALRKITDPARLPDLTQVYSQIMEPSFQEAQQRSLAWFEIDSTRQFFPLGPISHDLARASVYALGQMRSIEQLLGEFDVWESVGWNGQGEVFYTAYFTPQFRGSRTRSGPYIYPLYKRPDDLVSDPITGAVIGRRTAIGNVPYPARRQIESSNMLAGQELVYLPGQLDAYIAHVNGSAQITLTDGSVIYVGYAGTNGHEYTSIGRLLAEAGELANSRVSLPAIRTYFSEHPAQLDKYVNQNDRFVFFREYDGSNWPAGSLGFQVTPMRSLATDKSVFPRGCAVFVDTTFPTPGGATSRLNQLMLDQDTGGAIRAAGRGDIYVGIGPEAGMLAGRQAAVGRLFYLLLRPQRLHDWLEQMGQDFAFE